MIMARFRTFTAFLGGPRFYLLPRGSDEPENRRARDPRTPALIGLLIVLLLVIGGVLLVHELGRASQLQDCVMSGRTNCAPIDPSTLSSH
jgi:hypothetical protein